MLRCVIMCIACPFGSVSSTEVRFFVSSRWICQSGRGGFCQSDRGGFVSLTAVRFFVSSRWICPSDRVGFVSLTKANLSV